MAYISRSLALGASIQLYPKAKELNIAALKITKDLLWCWPEMSWSRC